MSRLSKKGRWTTLFEYDLPGFGGDAKLRWRLCMLKGPPTGSLCIQDKKLKSRVSLTSSMPSRRPGATSLGARRPYLPWAFQRRLSRRLLAGSLQRDESQSLGEDSS